ncbi:MAG: hypothetical protein NTV62_03635 [Candidatus Gribaldobacteria bacterium]|nr:hypothetical protein [Candidatus Gribaldobacteria bacterium]
MESYIKKGLIAIMAICSLLLSILLSETMGQSYNQGTSYQPFEGFTTNEYLKLVFWSLVIVICSGWLALNSIRKNYKKIIFPILLSLALLTTISLGVFREISGATLKNDEGIRIFSPVDWINLSNALLSIGAFASFALMHTPSQRVSRFCGLTVMTGLGIITLSNLLLFAPTWSYWPRLISEYGLKVGVQETPYINHIPSLFLSMAGSALAVAGLSLEWAGRKKKAQFKIPVRI